ncbi:ATP dependent DEAD-box helicase, putative [Plasmodium gallinaceum]|uniref:ATP dependent DEAD-box helicase, putative n=1 Tax=Plasmodium gallinaceum TaxID=5849 RepID=A0A1J1GN61_PLAGA|nr:ATP dependent DEAD-box helicase, putative [Plasmodium gallinaceum]CRG93813.1 ATP dependent DEAD-box helicase, putative [Plasmodium gallinaceum]
MLSCFNKAYLKNTREISKDYLLFILMKKSNFSYIRNTNTNTKKINEEYKNIQRVIPLNENELLKIRNILIKITNEKHIFHKIVHFYNIPSFFILDNDVRNHFLNYLKEDLTYAYELREFIMNKYDDSKEEVVDLKKKKIELKNEKVDDIKKELENKMNDIKDRKYEKIINILQTFIKKYYYRQWIFYEQIKKLCDFTEMNEFIKNRKNKNKSRKLYLYVGPTNSGKTHEAFKKLAESKNGLYCAPLRLLAWEIHNKLIELDKVTNLLTGQEVIKKDNNTHTICTIEMTPLNRNYDCAIIDEIQMINNGIRGHAWTNVLINLNCEEIYLCGSENVLHLIKNLSDILNDQLVIKRFKRLSKLELQEKTENLENVKTGDCIITFSRSNIMLLKRRLEKLNKRVFVIYGNLPPESKKKQIELFNYYCQINKESNEYSNNNLNNNIKNADMNDENIEKETVLIATDVIGMGLNTLIKRIIFYSLKKYDGDILRYLYISEILQISGRAGRFQENCENNIIGYITCIHLDDLNILKTLFKSKNINNFISNDIENSILNINANDNSSNLDCNTMNFCSNTYRCEGGDFSVNDRNTNTVNDSASLLNSKGNSENLEIFLKENECNSYPRAGYFPDFNTIDNLGKILEFEHNAKIKLYEILQVLIDYLKLNERYFFLTKNYNQMIFIAKLLESINLDKHILFIYTLSPINISNVVILNILKVFCMCHSLLGYVDFFQCINKNLLHTLNAKDNFKSLSNNSEHEEKNQFFQNDRNTENYFKTISDEYSKCTNSNNCNNYIFNNNIILNALSENKIIKKDLQNENINNNISFDEYIQILEVYYEIIDLYCWLNTKFPDIYKNIDLVNDEKKKVSTEIINMLTQPLNENETCVNKSIHLKKFDTYYVGH